MSQPLSHTPVNQAFPADDLSLAGSVHAPSARQVAHLNSVLERAQNARHSAENEKSRLAERLQGVIDALPAAVVVLDGQGRVQESNPAAEALLQTPLNGRLWRELITELFEPHESSGEALSLKSGRLVTLSTRPLGCEPGQVLMLQDVTDTHQLRSRLEQFRRLADMGRMAASLAHQIRTPLASAMLYLSQLKSNRLEAERRERCVTRAMTSLQGLERLIGDMLLFANGDSGKREAVAVQQLFESAYAELAEHCHRKGAELVLEQTETSAQVEVNRVLMQSALANLINNAVEAGADRIILKHSCSPSWCELVIVDNGKGIEPAERERIFEPFVSNRSSGTGLGLAVVRAVVQAMSGEIRVHSRPGEGAAFAIRLPRSATAQGGMTAMRNQQG